MNQVLKYAAYGIGSFTVLGGSFFMAAALSGTPMSAIPGVGGMFPEPVQPETKEEVQDLREELAQDRRSAGQVYGRARSPLQAFLLDNPFSAGELEQITEDLKAERRAVAMQEAELEQLRAELVEERQHYQDLFVELEELRTALVTRGEEQKAREEELRRKQKDLEGVERTSFEDLSPVFTEGKAKDSAAMLTQTYDPEQAAMILTALETERAAALLAEIHQADPEQGPLYMDAYRKARITQTQEK